MHVIPWNAKGIGIRQKKRWKRKDGRMGWLA